MSLSFIITSRPVTAICVECLAPFVTEEVTDDFGYFVREAVCDSCISQAEDWLENQAYDLWADR